MTPPPRPRRVAPVRPRGSRYSPTGSGSRGRRGVPRTGRVLLRTLRGLGRSVAALELTLSIKAGPELRSVIGSPVWGQYLAALAERVLTRKTYLRLAGAAALAALLDYLADGLGWSWLIWFGWLVTWIVAVPVAAVVTVLTARRFYRRSAYSQPRELRPRGMGRLLGPAPAICPRTRCATSRWPQRPRVGPDTARGTQPPSRRAGRGHRSPAAPPTP